MIIVSKFKDYYDGGAAFGVDTSRRYIRERQEIDYPRFSYYFNVIGFCGKIYPFDCISLYLRDDPKKNTNYNPKYYFQDYKDKIGITRYYLKKDLNRYWYGYWWDREYSRMTKIQLFEEVKKNKKLLNLFIEYQTPIFHIGKPYIDQGTILTLNPCLKDYAFYKVMDTTQAFQEIEMFLGNALVSDTKVIVPVGDDNVIRDSKGFDKWTFRREPEK